MCLFRNGCRKKAKEDIHTYKILTVKEVNSYLRIYNSPYYKSEKWELGVTKTITKKAKPFYGRDIKDGYLHSHKWLRDAELECTPGGWYIFNATIPKGTWYYEGIDSNGREGYASKSLRIDSMKTFNCVTYDSYFNIKPTW